MSICTDKTIVIYALGRYSPLFILSVQSKFCLLFDNCVHVFVFCVWCVEDQSCGWHFDGCWDRNLFLFFKITHWWHCSLFFGGFQVLALSLLCYAALRWALLNCDSEDISLISKRWQHELNILILDIVFKTSDGMWCVCECGISFFSYWWHNYCLPCIFLRNSSSFVQNFDYSSLMGPFWHFAFTPNPDIIIVNSSTTSSLFVGVFVGVFDNLTNTKSHIFASQCLSSAKE